MSRDDEERREYLADYTDYSLETMAALRMLELVGADSVFTQLMVELIERRGVDPYSTDREPVRVAADVQMNVLANFGKVIGMIADGDFPEFPEPGDNEGNEDWDKWADELGL